MHDDKFNYDRIKKLRGKLFPVFCQIYNHGFCQYSNLQYCPHCMLFLLP